MKKKFAGLLSLILCMSFSLPALARTYTFNYDSSVSATRNNVAKYAYDILNYEWTTSSTIYRYNGSSYTSGTTTGTIHGIPYNVNGGDSFETYKNRSSSQKAQKNGKYMQYGMVCATFVTDCVRQGFPSLNLPIDNRCLFHKRGSWKGNITSIANDTKLFQTNHTLSDWQSIWTSVKSSQSYSGYPAYQQLKRGDYLDNYNHVLLVIDNNNASRTITYIEQNVCRNYGETDRVGTFLGTYSYNSLSNNNYVPMYVKYPNDEITYTWNGHRYQIFNESLTWTQAKAKCEELGGHLATITSQAEYNYIIGILPTDKTYLYFLGANYSGGRWQWITGESFSFTAWHSGEPSNPAGEPHIELENYWHSGWGWNDSDGTYTVSGRTGFICEWDDNPITVDTSPTITDVPNTQIVAGEYFSYQCKASGNVTSWSTSNGTIPSSMSGQTYTRNTIPDRLSINSSTGLISGTTPHTSAGKSSRMPLYYYFNVNASNSGGTATKSAFIPVWEPPVITTASLPSGTVGRYYNQTITAEGTEWSMEWEIESGSLPPDLKFNGTRSSRTATITGTPTTAGVYQFTVRLENHVGNPSTTTRKTFRIVIGGGDLEEDPYLRFLYTFKNGKVGEYYWDYVRLTGRSTYNTLVISGNRPKGLQIRRSGMYVYMYGTPEESGTFNFSLRANGSYSSSGHNYGYTEKSFPVYIAPSTPTPFRDSSMSISYVFWSGRTNALYSDYVYVRGGTASFTPEVVSGAVPPGFSLEQSGRLTYLRGKTTRPGTYNFTIRVTGSHGGYTEKAFSLYIAQSLTGADDEDDETTKPKNISTKLPEATVRTEYAESLTATGAKPITWEYVSGNLPESFTISEAGEVRGLPLETGKYKFKVKATNSVGSATKNITLKVNPAKPAITTLSLPDGIVGEEYSYTLEADGTEPIKFSKSGKFPKGLKLNKTTGEISGTPKKAGTYDFAIKAKNKSGTDVVNFSVTINAEAQEKDENSTNNNLAVPSYSVANAELFASDYPDEESIKISAGEPLTLKIGEGIKDFSSAEIFIDDEVFSGAEISDSGTFTIPGELVNGEFSVYVKAGEVETNEVEVSAEPSEENSSGCNIGLAGFALLGVFFLKKR